MQDFFGYDKQSKGPGNVVSAPMALLSIDAKAVWLVQNFQLSYARMVQPLYQFGNESVYMMAGNSSGTIAIDRAIGEVGLLKPYRPNDACTTQNIVISKGTAACGMDPGTVVAANSLLQEVRASGQANGLNISDGATWFAGVISVAS